MELQKLKYVERYKEIYKRKTGKEISDLEALEGFEKLTALVEAVYKPIPRLPIDEKHYAAR